MTHILRGYVGTLRDGVGEVLRRPGLRHLVLAAALVPMAFDEYLPLLARDVGLATVAVPPVLLVPSVATIGAGLLVGYRPFGRVGTALTATGLLVIGGALLHSVPGVVLVGFSFGVYQFTRLALEARIQDTVEGDARATVTSVHGLLSEGVALAVVTAYGVGTLWFDLSWLFVANGVLVIGTAAYAVRALRPRRAG